MFYMTYEFSVQIADYIITSSDEKKIEVDRLLFLLYLIDRQVRRMDGNPLIEDAYIISDNIPTGKHTKKLFCGEVVDKAAEKYREEILTIKDGMVYSKNKLHYEISPFEDGDLISSITDDDWNDFCDSLPENTYDTICEDLKKLIDKILQATNNISTSELRWLLEELPEASPTEKSVDKETGNFRVCVNDIFINSQTDKRLHLEVPANVLEDNRVILSMGDIQ